MVFQEMKAKIGNKFRVSLFFLQSSGTQLVDVISEISEV